MSKASARPIPSVRAVCAAAATPAAGPDMAIVSGRALAASTDIMPPPECRRCRARPAGSRARRSSRYAVASGMTDALSTVVHARSYSRNSALISLETERWRKCGASNCRSACSCAALA